MGINTWYLIMFKFKYFFAALVTVVSCNEYYNILSIDGGGIRGLIPGVVIREMEKFAYKYATDNGLMEKILNDDATKAFVSEEFKAIHMVLLFDFTAGTSTGSIIAAGLAKPKMEGDVATRIPQLWG